MESEIVMRDDDTAELLGKLTLALARVRLRWGMFFLRGWPARMFAALPEGQENGIINTLQRDFANFEILTQAPQVGLVAELVKRHAFQTVPAQQVHQAVQQAGGGLSAPLRAWLEVDGKRFWGTQLIEDSFKRESRRVQVKSNTVSSHNTQFNTLLQKKVISSVHKYREPTGDGIVARGLSLPQESFYAWKNKASMHNMSSIVGTKKAPEWYTSQAASLHVPHMDLALIQFALSNNQVPKLDGIWKNHILKGENYLIRRNVGGTLGPWLFPLGTFGSTAAVGWPADQMDPLQSSSPLCFQPREATTAIQDDWWLCVLDLAEYEAMEFNWRSISWQQAHWRADYGRIVAVAGPVQPVATLMAKRCFWGFPRSVLTKFASDRGIDTSSGDTLYELLEKMVMGFLSCSDAECLDILKLRAGPNEACLELFLSCGAGLEALDKSDEKAARKVQKKTAIDEAECKDFRKDYKAERKARRAAETAQQAAEVKRLAKSRGRGKAAPRAPAGPRLALPIEAPTQAEAKAIAPPGAHIWRELVRGGWAVHYAPYRRFSSSWKIYGAKGAAVRCLQYAWALYMDDHGLDHCPVQGLMEEPVVAVTDE